MSSAPQRAVVGAALLLSAACSDRTDPLAVVSEPHLLTASAGEFVVSDCSSAGLQAAVDAATAAGGGTVSFNCPSGVVTLNRAVVLAEAASNVVIDGGGTVTLQYSYPAVAPGTPPPSPAVCPTNSKYWYAALVVNGANNTIRKLATTQFPEGIQLRGPNNLIEELSVRVTCDEAAAIGAYYGAGSPKNRPAPGSVIRNSTFRGGPGGGKNKGIQINTGDVTIEGSTFVDINLPIRAVYETQRVVMRGNSFPTGTGESGFAGQGPQFSSVVEPVIFENNTGSQKYGILTEGGVRAIVKDNVFTRVGSNGRNAILALGASRVWAEGNTMTGYTATNSDGATVRVAGTAQVDLGGGSLAGFEGSSRGNNIIRNGRNGHPFDVKNETQVVVMARGNYWDHATVETVRQHDVSGLVEVDPVAPAARIEGPYTGVEGSDVAFQGDESSGIGLSYQWEFGDGATGTGATPTHAYADEGVYTVTLTVVDAQGASSVTSTTATIANAPPVVDELPAATLLQGEVYTAAGAFADPGSDRWSATVDYGDGAGPAPLALAGKTFTLEHRYIAAGSFTLRVQVQDGDGGADEASAPIRVLTPVQGIDVVSSTLEEVVARGAIEYGHANALEVKLRIAVKHLEKGETTPSLSQLRAFTQQVEAHVGSRHLAAEDGTRLVAQADRVIRSIESL